MKIKRRTVLKGLSAAALVPAVTVRGSAQAGAKVLKFGSPLPLTGPLAPEGVRQRQGFDSWLTKVNETGGIKAGGDTYKVEIVYIDYQSNTPRAVQSAERLINEDKVQFLFAPFGSAAVKAVSAVTEKYGVPMVAPNAASEQVYDQGFKYLFGVYTPNHTLAQPMVKLVRQKRPNLKRLSILARNDLFPLAMAAEIEKAAKEEGLEVVYNEKYAIGTVDFSSPFTEMRSRRPEWIFISGYTNDLILARKQLREQGVTGDLLTMAVGPATAEFQNGVGALGEGVTTFAWWDKATKYKGVDIFGSAEAYADYFEKQYKILPDYSQAGSAACGVIFQLAIEKVGSIDRAKVRDAIAAMDLMTFYGPIKFGPSGQISSLKPPIIQLQDKVMKVVYPPEIAQAELRFGFK